MKKIINPGKIKIDEQIAQIFCKIKINDGKLSISGVIGPKKNGDSIGSSGQIDMGFKHRNDEDDSDRNFILINPDEIKFSNGWGQEMWWDFLDIWGKWHLNDSRSGCEHQRKAEWGKKKVEIENNITRKIEKKSTGWLYEKEHPEGVLCKACPECGYKYGTAWLKEELPQEVINFLEKLPETENKPVWV